jgi:hypothetical protein
VLDDAAWSAFAARVDARGTDLRRRLAERWSRAALAEHASIASFARFTLQLLRGGLDEIEHARLSFRVASVFAGRSLGPGPLPIPPFPGEVTPTSRSR